MIKYALKCAQDHRFESWFQDSAAFEKLQKAGLLSCAICGDAEVHKAIMAPRVKAATDKATPDQAEAQPSAEDMHKALRAFREHVERNTDDVGTAFASTARKMHDGELEHRPIRGQANQQEARELAEDGIDVTPLPWDSRKTN